MNMFREGYYGDERHCFAGNRHKQLTVYVSKTLLRQALYQCSLQGIY